MTSQLPCDSRPHLTVPSLSGYPSGNAVRAFQQRGKARWRAPV